MTKVLTKEEQQGLREAHQRKKEEEMVGSTPINIILKHLNSLFFNCLYTSHPESCKGKEE